MEGVEDLDAQALKDSVNERAPSRSCMWCDGAR